MWTCLQKTQLVNLFESQWGGIELHLVKYHKTIGGESFPSHQWCGTQPKCNYSTSKKRKSDRCQSSKTRTHLSWSQNSYSVVRRHVYEGQWTSDVFYNGALMYSKLRGQNDWTRQLITIVVEGSDGLAELSHSWKGWEFNGIQVLRLQEDLLNLTIFYTVLFK